MSTCGNDDCNFSEAVEYFKNSPASWIELKATRGERIGSPYLRNIYTGETCWKPNPTATPPTTVHHHHQFCLDRPTFVTPQQQHKTPITGPKEQQQQQQQPQLAQTPTWTERPRTHIAQEITLYHETIDGSRTDTWETLKEERQPKESRRQQLQRFKRQEYLAKKICSRPLDQNLATYTENETRPLIFIKTSSPQKCPRKPITITTMTKTKTKEKQPHLGL